MRIGETTFDNGLEKLDLKHPILLKSLDFDKLYQVRGPTKFESFTLRNLVILPENKQKTEYDIISEIELHEYLQKIPKKPSLFPIYRGYIKSKDDIPQMTSYTLIFESLEKPLEVLLQEKRRSSDAFSFDSIYFYFKTLINGFSFMQTLDLFPFHLQPESIFVTTDNILKFLTFTFEKSLARDYKSRRIGFIAPEAIKINSDWDIYKSESFTLAIIILYMGTFQIPRQEMIIQDANELLDLFTVNYIEKSQTEDEKFQIMEFQQILKSMIEGDPSKRLDFIGVFSKIIDLKNKFNLRKHILIEDGMIYFIFYLFLSKYYHIY